MTDIVPLLRSSPDSRLGELLRAAADEQPSRALPQKILVGLGAGLAATGASAVASGATASPPAAAISGGGILVAKWLALGLVGGLLATAGLDAVTSSTSSAPPAVAPARTSIEVSAVVLPPVSAPPAPVAEAAAEVARIERAASTPTPPVADTSSRLREEVRLIDAARAALAAGAAERALRELQTYRRVAQTGMLDREARVLHIEALAKVGDLKQARALAEAYSADFPRDAHARRLRALTAEGARGSTESVGDMNRAERSE
ncbi:MAG: hypothetical protein WDO74_06880 [Pseudomonadota bacterium]